jgi:hypothetical protein
LGRKPFRDWAALLAPSFGTEVVAVGVPSSHDEVGGLGGLMAAAQIDHVRVRTLAKRGVYFDGSLEFAEDRTDWAAQGVLDDLRSDQVVCRDE